MGFWLLLWNPEVKKLLTTLVKLKYMMAAGGNILAIILQRTTIGIFEDSN